MDSTWVIHGIIHVLTLHPSRRLSHFHWWVKSIYEISSHNITTMITTLVILCMISTWEWYLFSKITLCCRKVFWIIPLVCCWSCLWYFRSAHGGYRLFTCFDTTSFSLTYCGVCFSCWSFITFEKNLGRIQVWILLW